MNDSLNREGFLGKLLIWLFLGLVLVISLFPVYLMVTTALKTNPEIAANVFKPPSKLYLSNFERAWVIGKFGTYFWNSIIVTFFSVVLVLVLSLVAGFCLGALKDRIIGERAIFSYFLIGFTIPFYGYMVPLFLNLRDLGLLNSRTGVTLTLTAVNLPFGVFLMRSFFRTFPSELLDSARIDGCNVSRMLISIAIPIAKPAMLALVVVQAIWSWNDLIVPLLILQKDSLRTVSVGLTFFQTRFGADYALVAAGSTLAVIPPVLLYVLFQRHLEKGLLGGALK